MLKTKSNKVERKIEEEEDGQSNGSKLNRKTRKEERKKKKRRDFWKKKKSNLRKSEKDCDLKRGLFTKVKGKLTTISKTK